MEAENEEEAAEVADAIVNAELNEGVEEKIESLHYHDGYGSAEIQPVG